MLKTTAVAMTLFLFASSTAPFSPEEDKARVELLELAPVQSDSRIAKKELENKGFKCKWIKQGEFYQLEGKHDYLYCDQEVKVGLFVNRRWQLALIHKDFLVQDAKFGIGLIGL